MECWVKAILSVTSWVAASPPQLLHPSAPSLVCTHYTRATVPCILPNTSSPFLVVFLLQPCWWVERASSLWSVFCLTFVFEIGFCYVTEGGLEHITWPLWLTWSSLTTYDKHLCICFSAILRLWKTFSSSFSSVQLMCPVNQLLNYKSCHYILETRPLLDTTWKYFLWFEGCPFNFFMIPFNAQKFLI